MAPIVVGSGSPSSSLGAMHSGVVPLAGDAPLCAEALRLVEEHRWEALFLLSNIQEHGWTSDAQKPTSMTTWASVNQQGRVSAVVGLCVNRSMLVVGRGLSSSDAEQLVANARAHGGEPKMLMGSFQPLQQLCIALGRDAHNIWKDAVLRLDLPHSTHLPPVRSRAVAVDEFPMWDVLQMAMGSEIGMPRDPNVESRRAAFDASVALGRAFGAFEGTQMIGTALIGGAIECNTPASVVAIVVGVFVDASVRRRGRARDVMLALIDSAKLRLGFSALG